MKKNEQNHRDLWDTIKCANIYIKGASVGDKREKEAEGIYEELMAKIFPNMKKTLICTSKKLNKLQVEQT